MVNLCDYSTVIYAGNVSVLLVVAICTNYWSYREFYNEKIEDLIESSNQTQLIKPHDTSTYLLIRKTFHNRSILNTKLPSLTGRVSVYQPPVIIYELFEPFYNTTRRIELDIVVFSQYGNLYKDCDNLEIAVRKRLGLREKSCTVFVIEARGEQDYIKKELPFIIYLEIIAFLLAILSIATSWAGSIGGAYAALSMSRNALTLASASTLISAFSLTLTIAFFHIKCHLIKRRELLGEEHEVSAAPLMDILEKSRHDYYGWSFVLSWICVAFQYTGSYLWLRKASDAENLYQPASFNQLVTPCKSGKMK